MRVLDNGAVRDTVGDMRPLFFGLIAVGVAPPANACMWDRDTLAQEYRAAPGAVEVITGRFERFPPRYYEMRLQRVAGELEKSPTSLTLFDDAGVASDRLNRSVDAIDWMSRKKAEMDRQNLPADHEHRYRYEANLGTFLFHQWMRDGAARERLGDAKSGRDHIERAIELKPDAHFGREKYQLMAMNWIIGRVEEPLSSNSVSMLGVEGSYPEDMLFEFSSSMLDADEAFRGISGLITLGAAWENVDVHFALLQVLQAQEHGQLSVLGAARVRELQAQGKKSFASPGVLDERLEMVGGKILKPDIARSFFDEARGEANAWQQARFQFMEEQFSRGNHPDTHPEFWEGFAYSGQPVIPPFGMSSETKITMAGVAMIFLAFGIPGAALFLWGRSVRPKC